MRHRIQTPLRLPALLVAVWMALQLTAVPAPVSAASSSEIKERIEELKEQGEELQDEIDTLESQISDNFQQMEDMVAQKDILDQQIFLLRQQMLNIEDQILAYNLLIADKQDELDAAQERLDDLTEQNRDRIRAMEMYGEMSYWSVLAQAGSFGEFLDRLSMVAEISRADVRRIAQLRDAAQAVEQARALLEGEKAALEEIRQGLARSQQELEAKRQLSQQLLSRLYATGQEYQQYLERKEEENAQLMEQIGQAEQEYTEAKRQEYLQWLSTSVPPTTTKGSDYDQSKDHPGNVVEGISWTMPIRYTKFTSPYGWREQHPIYGDRRFHHGVDLAAPEGTPIYAARSGVVTVATYSDSAGWYVTINHGDGFSTIYMHMTHYTVKEGQRVTAGQKIGECGNTGASDGNHLHFGVYYNGKSQNPAKYIGFY